MTESDTDPGGRLGPAIWEETRCSPDLRNLRVGPSPFLIIVFSFSNMNVAIDLCD